MVLMNLFSGQQWRLRYREQTCGPGDGGVGEEREGQIESNIETYTLLYIK